MSHISIASAAPQGTVPHNTESLRVEELIPLQLRESSEKFIHLIKDYYDYLNTEGLPTYEINRIVDEHDIDKVSDRFLDGIQGEIARNIPDSVVVDRVSLYKKIIKYYTLKGSEESITTFFRLFFDEIIKVSYPREKLFSLSSGDWKPANDNFIRTITGALVYGELASEFNYTPFDLKKGNTILGNGKIVDINPVELYKNPPSIGSLIFNINASQDLNSITETWDSTVLDKDWRGYFRDGASFNRSEELVSLDGESAYIDFEKLENHPVSLNNPEHTFAIRLRPRYNKENDDIQGIFSLSEDYGQSHSHELFVKDGLVGRSFIDLKEPNIESVNGDTILKFSNFIDEDTSELNKLAGNEYDHMSAFLAPLTEKINGEWNASPVVFNGKNVYLHNEDPALNTIDANDLRFYTFEEEETTFNGPKNIKVANSIPGISDGDQSGPVALSEDGNTMVVGSPGANASKGQVKIYNLSLSPDEWILDDTLNGSSANDMFGTSVAISSDGTTIAVGAPNVTDSSVNECGEVKIYKLSGGTWSLDHTVNSDVPYKRLGSSVKLNEDGTRVIIGASPLLSLIDNSANALYTFDTTSTASPLPDEKGISITADFIGESAVYWGDGTANGIANNVPTNHYYTWNATNGSVAYDTLINNSVEIWEYDTSWTKIKVITPLNIAGNNNTVDISKDGNTVAIGYNGTNEFGVVQAYVKAYFYNGSEWNQLGLDFVFRKSSRRFAFDGQYEEVAISLSGEGNHLAIGIIGDGSDLSFKGNTEIYKINRSNSVWSKIGKTLEGENIGDQSGASVALNTKGDVVAIGGPNNDEGQSNAGHTRIYQIVDSNWKRIGADIDGQSQNDQSGTHLDLNGTGSRVAISSPSFSNLRGKIDVYQLSIFPDSINIDTFLFREKNPNNNLQSRWAIKSYSETLYYTDWFIIDKNPYDANLRWVKAIKHGKENLPILPHCDYLKKNSEHIFTLHNRGYMSISYKYNDDKYIPYQNITIGDPTQFGGERLWDILDFDVDNNKLVLLDKPVNGETRVVVFKLDQYNKYQFDQVLTLNLPYTHRGLADFVHIKIKGTKLVVGTHTRNNKNISQVIHSYEMIDGVWDSTQYDSLGPVKLQRARPTLEFDRNDGVETGIWKSTNGDVNLTSNNISSSTALDSGITFSSGISTDEGIGFGIDSDFALALRFISRDDYSESNKILSIGGITLRLAKNPLANSERQIEVVHSSGSVFLDKSGVVLNSNVREIFSDEYYNPKIEVGEWNNLIVEFIVNNLNEIIGLRYSLNGFKRSKVVSFSSIGITLNSSIDLGPRIGFSNISVFDKPLTHIEFERVERLFSGTYSNTITTGINSLLDGGKFEISESGNIIIKTTSYGINIWIKSEDGWKGYYNALTSITSNANNYITHTGSRQYSYKFFGDDLLIANGGLNNAQEYLPEFDDSITYNRKEHNSSSKLYYIKSDLQLFGTRWSLDREISPSVEFTQKDDENFKIGLNYGVDIAIDNENNMFGISLEPNSIDIVLSGPNVTIPFTSTTTSVRYDIWKKISSDIIERYPFRDEADQLVTSYSGIPSKAILTIFENVPSYNALLTYPEIIHTKNIDAPLVKYSHNSGVTLPGYYLQNNGNLIDDFVISTPHSEELYLPNIKIPFDSYSTIVMRGKADRYNGFVDISINDSDFISIIKGNTIDHLTVGSDSRLAIGKNTNGYFNGEISHGQYYTTALSDVLKSRVFEYFYNNTRNFYEIIFDEFSGETFEADNIKSLPGAEKLNEDFLFDTLSGHVLDTFWSFDAPQIGSKLAITADYVNLFESDRIVYWGDGRKDTILDSTTVRHLYGTDYLGKYEDRKGHASSINKVQDSNFWQNFSYVIRSGLRVADWEKQFINLVHPAGLKFFASVILLVIRDNHWFGPKWVTFDSETRENESLIKVDDKFLSPYRTKQPLEDMRWLESLTAPNNAGGYHMPMFQPGWLQGDIRVREFIFEAGLWTKLARSVPGNAAAASYTYEYLDGNPAEDFEIRVLSLNGPELEVGDIVYQGNDSPPRQGVITNISPDGNEFTGIVKLVGTSLGFTDGDIYTENSPITTATITAIPVKKKTEIIQTLGDKEQEEAYLLQDQSSINVNSEMFLRAVLTTFKYVIPSLVPQMEFTRRDYLQNLKFKDVDDISSYLNTSIKDAIDDSFTFMNVGAIIKKRNQLYTEGGEGIYLESDSSPFNPDEGILLDDIAAWWNDPTNDDDVSAPVQIDITSYTGPQLVHGDTVYQDIIDSNGDSLIIEGLITGTLNDGDSILVGWRGAINTSASPDLTLPSKPELDQLFRDGTIYTIQGQYDSPMPTSPVGIAKITEAVVTIST